VSGSETSNHGSIRWLLTGFLETSKTNVHHRDGWIPANSDDQQEPGDDFGVNRRREE
jgi:hypothetical protein